MSLSEFALIIYFNVDEFVFVEMHTKMINMFMAEMICSRYKLTCKLLCLWDLMGKNNINIIKYSTENDVRSSNQQSEIKSTLNDNHMEK